MKKLFLILALLVLQAVPTLAEDSKMPANENFVRLSLITVDPARLEEYKAYLKEGVTASMSREPGVLVLYPTTRKDAPNVFTILEIYANRAAYESHIKSAHFQKYKQGTLDMVQSLELVDVDPLVPRLKIK
ncbi:putative quinol monooxygenase [Desulfovibrio sp. An276]|uniref:putative quinol monooxygenase n=1 Tax=Desulfovibrio sp. An276 TaxID=1965618 RepID=UPI001950F18E|nr:antibiotic biosynthesis monooxygenase [Desulfovibrio sp. An276]